MDLSRELLDTALRAAEAAARVHLDWIGRVSTAEVVRKGRADFVSRVDLEAQEAALAVITRRFPSHAILPEEDDGRPPGPERSPETPLWIVDPLDGTTNFLHGHPAYCSSVGVWIDGEPAAGAVVAAASEERWWASSGQGAWRNGVRIQASGTRELASALVGTGFPFKHPEQLPRYLSELGRVLGSTSGVRRCGSAALDLCYLAQGTLDAFWEGTLAPWDVAAGLAILSEAGGVALRRDGSAIAPTISGPVVAAGSRPLLTSLQRVLDGVSDEESPVSSSGHPSGTTYSLGTTSGSSRSEAP